MLSEQLGYGVKEPDQGRGGGTGGSKSKRMGRKAKIRSPDLNHETRVLNFLCCSFLGQTVRPYNYGDIRLKILTPCIPPFKVIGTMQHGSMDYLTSY